jgi:hypothetical protein
MHTKLIPFAAVVVVACGGGLYDPGTTEAIDTTGADAPANFTSAVDAAKAAAAIAAIIAPNGGISGKARGKSSTTTPCDAGSVTFITDDTTAYPDDGRHFYDQCTAFIGDNQLIQDGVSVDRCSATASNDTVCTSSTFTGGEGGVPLTLEGRSSSSDTILRFLTSGVDTTSGSTVTETLTGTIEQENLLAHKSLAQVSSHLTSSATSNNDGSVTASANGTFGLNNSARFTANCMSGRMTVSTPTAMTLDTNANFIGGQLHFTSESGTTGNVVFNSDGSVSASVNGGASAIFSRTLFLSYCSVD